MFLQVSEEKWFLDTFTGRLFKSLFKAFRYPLGSQNLTEYWDFLKGSLHLCFVLSKTRANILALTATMGNDRSRSTDGQAYLTLLCFAGSAFFTY